MSSSLISKSIRGFIGAKNYIESQGFYRELGFYVRPVSSTMSYVEIQEGLGFYLQDYYVKKWVNNSMLFLELENLDAWEDYLKSKKLDLKYKYVRFTEIIEEDWGREFFMHDPSGVLWHFGSFKPDS